MPTWEELFKHEEHRWEVPHHTAVTFAEELREHRSQSVLDLGCGAGRHVVYLASLGFQVIASDISQTGLSVTQQRLTGRNLPAHLHLCDLTSIPLADSSIDAVVTLYVIYHNYVEGIRRTVEEIGRVLRPSGLLLISLISDRGHRYGQGKEVEQNTFLPTLGADAGLPHHFFDAEGVQSLMESFHVTRLCLDEHEEQQEDGSSQLHSHWVCVAAKPG